MSVQTISTVTLRERARTQEHSSGDVHGVSVRPSVLLALVEAVEATIEVRSLRRNRTTGTGCNSRSRASGWRWRGSVAKRRKRKTPAPATVQVSLLVFLTNYRQMNLLLGRSRVHATVERVEAA